MSRSAIAVAAGIAALLAVAGASADERYSLERRGSVVVRLDHETGAVSRCEERGKSLVCEAAADDLAALQDEVARLDTALGEEKAKSDALGAENRALRRALRDAGVRPPEGSEGLAEGLPSEAEVKDLAGWIAMVARVMRGLMGEEERDAPSSDGKRL
ncbi:MAG: hypothetical protein H6923_02055 [Alphaproteobacteria bacterium]|nr:hypothetical protein [Alphaproteobacteria bacterium]